MTYDDLLRDERIRRHGLPRERLKAAVQACLELADREVKDCAAEGLSLDGRYQHAYAAVRALAEAVMLAEGFGPVGGPGQHHVLFEFPRLVPTAQREAEAAYFDSCRQRRHAVAYRRTGQVTQTELAELVEEAHRFRKAMEGWLAERHPGLVTL